MDQNTKTFSMKKSEVRSQESGVRSQESGVRSQKSGVRSQKSEVRSQKSLLERQYLNKYAIFVKNARLVRSKSVVKNSGSSSSSKMRSPCL